MTVRTLPVRFRRGVTLVEIMVVVVIIGILSGLTVPKFIQITGENQLDGDVQVIFADMAWAKTAAIRANSPYYIEFKDTTINSQTRTRWIVYDSLTKKTQRKGISGVSVRIKLPENINQISLPFFTGFSTSISNGFQDGLGITPNSGSCFDGTSSTIESWESAVKFCGGATGNMATGALYLTSARSNSRAYAIQYNRKKSLGLMKFRYIAGTWEAM